MPASSLASSQDFQLHNSFVYRAIKNYIVCDVAGEVPGNEAKAKAKAKSIYQGA